MAGGVEGSALRPALRVAELGSPEAASVGGSKLSERRSFQEKWLLKRELSGSGVAERDLVAVKEDSQ